MKILNEKDIAYAAELLKQDELVAIPTETVYGLGANSFSEKAVKKVFEVKGRASDNPLIIHVLGREELGKYCREIPEMAYRVAERFWPGPVTMVLKKKSVIPDFVSAGLDTVAIRCPVTRITRQLMAAVPFPICAPSANLSGRPSTTRVAHVLEDLEGKILAVLDGGDCTVGLESTIIDLSTETPVLLRPGGVTLEELRELLGEILVDKALTQPLGEHETPKAPGMKYRHYAPKAPVCVVRGKTDATAAYIAERVDRESGVLCFEEYKNLFSADAQVRTMGSRKDAAQQANCLFDRLRSFDQTEVRKIYAQCPLDDGIGHAVVNRLTKAAGFHIIDV